MGAGARDGVEERPLVAPGRVEDDEQATEHVIARGRQARSQPGEGIDHGRQVAPAQRRLGDGDRRMAGEIRPVGRDEAPARCVGVVPDEGGVEGRWSPPPQPVDPVEVHEHVAGDERARGERDRRVGRRPRKGMHP